MDKNSTFVKTIKLYLKMLPDVMGESCDSPRKIYLKPETIAVTMAPMTVLTTSPGANTEPINNDNDPWTQYDD